MPLALDTVPAPPVPALGSRWSLRTADPATDLPLLTRWRSAPHAAGFRAAPASPAHLAAELRDRLTGRATRPLVAAWDGEPVAYLELHRVLHHPLRGCYPVGAHDLAVDLLVGDAERTGRGLAPDLLRELVPAVFAADPRCRRVVAAPDESNGPAVRAFRAGGFRAAAEADLPDRTVVLLVAEPPRVAGVPTALDDMPH